MSTPVQRQYWELKNQNPEALLFFRLGDFYELFFEDALVGSKVLGITLTARHKGTDNEMPMCGFPYHAHKEYLETLIDHGYKVAIAEQVETEDKRIIRQIDRIVTPGTTLESGNLDQNQHNYLAAIHIDPKTKNYALAYTDLSTGDFRTCLLHTEIAFFDELYKINPKEILCDQVMFQNDQFTQKLPTTLVTPQTFLSPKEATNSLTAHFPANHLEVSGIASLKSLLIVASAVLNYAQKTQRTKLENVYKIHHYDPGHYMALDAQTFRHLEIFQASDPEAQKGTLLSVFEKSQTAMGGRTLASWCVRPLLKTELINTRLDLVESLQQNTTLQNGIRNDLKQIPDLERLIGKLANNRGNARDLVFIRQALSVFEPLSQKIADLKLPALEANRKKLGHFQALHTTLEEALQDEPPLEITQGNIIRDGYNPRLDELRVLQKDSKTWLDNFLEKTKTETGLQNVRIKYSKNFGFCLEISKAQAEKAPDSWVRRQTLVNAERFTTPELSDYETRVLSAEGESFELEHELFTKLRLECLTYHEQIQEAAHAIGQLDAALTLALTATKYRWNRPQITSDDNPVNISQGRHPVVEAQNPQVFIANNLKMERDNSQFHLISGPNMAGKSTFLRQNALIIFLGQIGSFVPAKSAQWGLVDRIFTRVGASDNLAAGKSTFFVEMTETATILHQATDRSFIILDEIGRGTSTFDGISLAWSITEYIHDTIGAKTLFATHYHELIDLAEDLSAAKNYHVAVTQNESGIVFLRQIKPGGISDSFGIEVARLAGIPTTVTQNAQAVLSRLESENLLSGKPNLFSMAPKPTSPTKAEPSKLEVYVEKLNPDDLSPKEALEVLYKIKNIEK